jgi:hypothetical protein
MDIVVPQDDLVGEEQNNAAAIVHSQVFIDLVLAHHDIPTGIQV